MHPNQKNVPADPVLSIRIDDDNPDHHLWCNHGVWWIHYVVHEGNRKRRVRRSLQTRDVEIARQHRDAEFARVDAARNRTPHGGSLTQRAISLGVCA